PHDSIEIAGAFLIGKDKLKEWKDALCANRARALSEWEAACRQARFQKKDPPPRPDREIFAPFPDVSTWTITLETLPCALEVGQAFSSLGRHEQAAAVFRFISEKLQDEIARVLASEGGADALAALLRYEQAIGLYEHALQTADKIVNYLKTDAFGEVRHIKDRIQAKLSDLRRRWDIDRYGQGYVLYREAEVLRREMQESSAAAAKVCAMCISDLR
ncbi:MAG: hypothetical protein N3A66_11805, partial [Planctomycetota bacterium]|nr:hypothetical protein [Planctomycetota bacterium]